MMKRCGMALRNATVICASLILGAVVASGQATVPVSGRVIATDTEMPIPDATVLAIELRATGARPPSVLQATTTEDGQFEFAAAPGVTYSVCVNAGMYLNPCQWSKPPVVTPGSGSAPLTIALEPGTPLRVTILDSNRLLDKFKDDAVSAVPAPPITVVAQNTTTGYEVPIPFANRGSYTVDYRAVLPAGPDWKILINSPRAQLVNDSGKTYMQGSLVEIPAATRSAHPENFTFGSGGFEADGNSGRVLRFSVAAVHP